DAKINHEPVRLIVDTGSVYSILDEPHLKRLGVVQARQSHPDVGTLIPEDLSTKNVGVGKIGVHKLRATKLETLEIGDRMWKHVSFGIEDLKPWKISDPDDPANGADGILGMDIFLNHWVLIDFAHRKLWFGPEKKAS